MIGLMVSFYDYNNIKTWKRFLDFVNKNLWKRSKCRL